MKLLLKHGSIIAIAVATIFIYFPIIINPKLILERGNDLQEQFWAVYYFIKQQVLINHSLPLWNNLWFSGQPLLPDPQFSLFYLPHLIFLFLPIYTAFLISFLAHTFLGGIGAYLLAKNGFRMSNYASLFAAIIYISSPKLAGFWEAGHPGLLESWAFLPFIVLSIIRISDQPRLKWAILLGVSLAGTFYTHTIIFLISVMAITIVWLVNLIFLGKRHAWRKSIIFFFTGGFVTFGLTAVTLLPQLEWSSQTTRFLLLNDRDVYPKWSGMWEFLSASFFTLFSGKKNILALDPEKWIPLGTATTILALYGFSQLKKGLKIILLISGLVIIIFALNNSSPLYDFLLDQDWYVLSRVSTRIWFIPIMGVTFLSAYAVEKLKQKKLNKSFLLLIALLTTSELVALSWIRINKPITQEARFAPKEVYEFLTQDKAQFRVFCLNRCLSQKEAALYNLELVEGYNTLVQKNYYKHMWQLSGAYWNYYTLALPPTATYTFGKPQPDPASLGEFNVKYVISPHPLKDKNFQLEREIGGYLVYKNTVNLARAYFQTDNQKPAKEAPIMQYTPNYIRVDTSIYETARLVLAEVWSPSWNAYLNGEEKVDVQEKPNTLRLVDIKPNTQFVDFRYEPDSFKYGMIITLLTIALIATYSFSKWKNR